MCSPEDGLKNRSQCSRSLKDAFEQSGIVVVELNLSSELREQKAGLKMELLMSCKFGSVSIKLEFYKACLDWFKIFKTKTCQ